MSPKPILITDFDGIWTASYSLINEGGRTHKVVSVNDTLAISILGPHLFSEVLVLTSGGTGTGMKITSNRIKEINEEFGLNITIAKCKSVNKAQYIEALHKEFVYFGDDITDIPVFNIRTCVYGAVPASAPSLLTTSIPSNVYVSDKSGDQSFLTDALTRYAYHVGIDPVDLILKACKSY